MGAGAASVGTFQKKEPSPAPGPPFALNSANNGLSVDPVSGKIVLGNTLAGVQAILLNDREIPFNGNLLHFTNTAGVLLFDPPQVRAQNATNSRSAVMEPQQISINSDDVPFPPTLIFGTSNPAQTMQLINAAGNLKAVNNGGNSFLSIFPLSGVYSIGDINASANGNFASVVDAANFFTYHNGTDVWLNVGPGASGFAIGHVTATSAQLVGLSTGHLVYGFTGKSYMDLNAVAGTIQYKIGDINASTNGTYLNINDLAQSFDFHNTTMGLALVNPQGGLLRLATAATNTILQLLNSGGGDGIQLSSNGNSLHIISGTGTIQVAPGAGENVGIGITSATAKLHLSAGVAAAGGAPFKFTSGVNLTAAEAGAVEWNGTNLFITQTAGPTRKTIAYTTDIPATPAIVVGTTVVSGGTTTRILFDNAGVLGEYTLTGTGTVVAMQTSPVFLTDVTIPLLKGPAAFNIQSNAHNAITLDTTSFIYSFGDLDTINNGTKLVLDDAARRAVDYRTGATTRANFSPSGLSINNGTTAAAFQLDVNGPINAPGTAGNTYRWNAASTAPGTTATPVFTSFYGGNTTAMGNPVGWILVNVAGTDRKVPFY